MKTSLKYFGLILLCGALIASCKKDESATAGQTKPNTEENQNPQTPENPEENGESQNTVTINIPGVDINEAGQMLSFGAEIEKVETRVSVADNGTVSWEDGDLVKVSVGAQVAIYQYDGSTSKFALKGGETPVTLSETAYLYYPANAFSAVGAEATLSVSGATSRDAFGDKNPMGAVLPQDSEDPIRFKNLCSILHVTVTGDRTMTSLVLANTAANISGEASVSWSGTGSAAAPTVSISSAATSQTISHEVNLSVTDADFFFIVPAATLSDLVITANLAGEGLSSFKLSRTGDLTMARSTITGVSFFAGLFHGGAGTALSPYKIADTRDFMNIQKYCANGYNSGEVAASHFLAAYYQQTEDIDFEDKALTPIASESYKFTGSYDGDNHSLSNFSVNISGDNQGLWAWTDGATLEHIAISNSTISCSNGPVGTLVGQTRGETNISYVTLTDISFSSAGNSGGLVGRATSGTTISHCDLIKSPSGSCTVAINGNTGGGLVGFGSCVIENCTNASAVSNSGNDQYHLGGIVGAYDGDRIANCSNTGTVTGRTNVGGIVGNVNANAGGTGVITTCFNTGTITSGYNGDDAAAGGIAGKMSGLAKIDACYNHGKVVSTYGKAGGIVGIMRKGTVNRCYSGKASAPQISAKKMAGGIAGELKQDTDIPVVINCAASAPVGGTDGYTMAGGIAGDVNNGIVANCAAMAAKVWATNKDNCKVGAVVGDIQGNSAVVHNCYSQANSNAFIGYSTNNGSTVANATKSGGVFGCFYSGTVKDCYYTKNSTTPGPGYEGGGTKNKLGNYNKEIGNGVKNGTDNYSFVTFANGQAGGSMKLKAGLTAGAQGVSYNSVDLSSWEGKKADSEQAYPSVLVALGSNYCD